MLRWAAFLSGTILLAGCSVFGIRSGTEQPTYQVVAELDEAVEVRRYGPRLAAEVEVEPGDEGEARNAAFRILANYIFGDNRAQEEIAMTAPVEIAKESEGETIAMTAPVETVRGDGRLTMRFFLPAAFTEANVPRPTDPRVRILTVPGETMAVRRFSGRRGADDVEAEEARLRATLDGVAWRPAGEAVAFFYDPPWTIPFLRRNEVALPVVDG
ncbi:MAG: heme-binding protein [Kiloniellales bacterium]|nr:heme-binding protein [Kiloniellales bacterium]